ncbi:MAG: hypothetical protein CVV12_04885 [Gammaproteobacteria bacterium HGW-Gammaproteobacteria-2]|jgi:hypothetical protein|nr:MAG: hypothetical protein CVV12_04885 [Gammaproteobacteria bacterium HGW-Gammaproteobacteria-2]
MRAVSAGTLAKLLQGEGLAAVDCDPLLTSAPGLAGAAGNPFARENADLMLRNAAEAEGLDAVRVLALDDADPQDLAPLPDATVRAYARALIATEQRKAGRVPAGWTQASACNGCGPVWLWPGAARVLACPWCWNRVRGLPVPTPG